MNHTTHNGSAPAYPLRLTLADLQMMRRKPLDFAVAFAQQHGDRVFLRFAGVPILFLNDPRDISKVLITQARALHKGRGTQRISPLVGHGLLTSDGEHHRQQRSVAQPAFHRTRLSQVVDIVTQQTQAQMAAWQHGEIIDLSDHFGALTLRVVGMALFHDDLADDTPTIRAGLQQALAAIHAYRLLPWSQTALRLPLPVSRRFQHAKVDLDQAIDALLSRRAARQGEPDLLGDLLHAAQAPDLPFTEADLRDNLMTFLLAGHETTANALCWTLALVANHPTVETRLIAELQTVLHGRFPTAADIEHLTYTRQVFLEALRLYPPVFVLGREVVQTPCQVGPFSLAAHTNIIISPYVVQRDPRWYADPLQFNPDRWSADARLQRPKLAFFPFGAGPRVCIGEGFALLEGVAALASILPRWHMERLTTDPVIPQVAVTLRPQGGLLMRVTQRVPNTICEQGGNDL